MRGVGQCLPEPGTKDIASVSTVYFKKLEAQSQIFTVPQQTKKNGQTKHLWSIHLVNLSKTSNYRKHRDANQTVGQYVCQSIYNCLFFE